MVLSRRNRTAAAATEFRVRLAVGIDYEDTLDRLEELFGGFNRELSPWLYSNCRLADGSVALNAGATAAFAQSQELVEAGPPNWRRENGD